MEEINVKQLTTEEKIALIREQMESTDRSDAMSLLGLSQKLTALTDRNREEKFQQEHIKNRALIHFPSNTFGMKTYVSNIQVHDKGIFLLTSDHNFVILGWDGKSIASGNLEESLKLSGTEKIGV